MSDNNNGDNSGNQNQVWSSWGYDLVCRHINSGHSSDASGKDDLQELFQYASDHETCFLEFKARPFMPDKERSFNNPHGFLPGETSDDYIWNIVKSIIALANTVGGAVILGINDKGHEPISEICKIWEGDKWDEFSNKLRDKIKQASYVIRKAAAPGDAKNTRHAQEKTIDLDSKKQKPCNFTIDLDDAECARLNDLCDIRHYHHKGRLIPVLLVKAVRDPDDFIYVKVRESNEDILFVRSKGDTGASIKLTGREIRRYRQPDETSYTSSRRTDTTSPERVFHNLCCIPEIIGRTDDLDRLNRAFVNDAHIQWIQGAPGVGKTAFIQKFIDKHCGDDHANGFDFAFFINAKGLTCAQAICHITSYSPLFKNFCGIELDKDRRNPYDRIMNSPEEAKPMYFKSWAHDIIKRLNDYRGKGYILIALDNVDSPTFFNDNQLDWILNGVLLGHIKICVTSRIHPEDNELISEFPLDLLSVSDALDILEQKKPITEQERNAAEEIVERVHHNAWAINFIGAQIEHDNAPGPYTRKLSELKELGITEALTDEGSGESLGTLYRQSIERLKNGRSRTGEALMLFALSAWFKQDFIPKDWLLGAFKRYLKQLNGRWSDDELKQNIDILRREGLIQWSQQNHAYRVQPLAHEVLWDLPQTYEGWRFVFETFKELLYANDTDDESHSQWHDQLMNFIDITLTTTTADKASEESANRNGVEVVKWIASAPWSRRLLSAVVRNFGSADSVRRIYDNLFRIAEGEYNHGQCSGEAIRNYAYFLSIKKAITTRHEQNINSAKELSKEIRTVFESIPQKTEKEEVDFAQELISDIRQFDKLYPYQIIEKDLRKAQDLILKHKNNHLGLLVKTYLEKANIELEFRKYHKVRKSLNQIIDITREAEKDLPNKYLLLCCKEHLAYMHLCECASSCYPAKFYHGLRAYYRYSDLIDELSSPSPEDQNQETFPGELILFKSHYFMALTLLQFKSRILTWTVSVLDFIRFRKKRIPNVNSELDTAFKLCDQIFLRSDNDGITATDRNKFNNLRIKSGIYRLKNLHDEALKTDLEAYTLHEQKNSGQPNLDIADLLDDYGNSHAQNGDYDKAIFYVNHALDIRDKLLPPTHAKIFNSYSRLAYLYGINAMRNGEQAHDKVKELLDDGDRTAGGRQLRSSSRSILRRLAKVMEFGDMSEKVFLNQIRKDEQKEECERVRTTVSDLQEKLLDKWTEDHSANQQKAP